MKHTSFISWAVFFSMMLGSTVMAKEMTLPLTTAIRVHPSIASQTPKETPKAKVVVSSSEKPVVTMHYTASHPAIGNPVLRWSRIDGAVGYEVQVLKPNSKGDMIDKKTGRTYTLMMPSQTAYTTGYELTLPASYMGQVFYWRVRGFDIDKHPISEYSDVEASHIDRFEPFTEKPTLMAFYNQGPCEVLLYPVYDWIAVPGAAKYELEILNNRPENPNGIEPSVHRIDSYTPTNIHQYDQKSRVSDTPFYWRVRAMDTEGNPIGVYSDALPFLTSPKEEKGCIAIFGDSISHGGGSISYSPTYWDFSYGNYLTFPTVNLAQSGDTSEMAVERFDRDVLPFQPSYLLILIGTNSLRAGVPSEDVIADLKTIKEKCLSHHIRPVFLTIPPLNPAHIKRAFDEPTADNWQTLIAEVNAYIRTQVHIDITPGMADEDGILKPELAVDGIHLDPPGKKMMGAAINNAWKQILALPDSAWK